MALKFFHRGGMLAWGLVGGVLLLMAASTMLFARTAVVRHERDVSRMVFNDNLQLLDEVRKASGALEDSAAHVGVADAPRKSSKPYIVVSIEDHRLWYKQRDSVLFTAPVATGSGRVLDGSANGQWKFETPRGRLVIQAKEADPAWVPPTGTSSSRHGSGGSASSGWRAARVSRRTTDHRSASTAQTW
jgi:L,D-transpeptidase catalytic domain.